MKQIYQAPKLTVYGTVSNLTHNTGLTSDRDSFFISGGPAGGIGGIDGSRDFFRNDDGGGGFQNQV